MELSLADIASLFSVGGDIAIWGVLVILWKFDRRLLKLETIMESHMIQDDMRHKGASKRLDSLETKQNHTA